jgi:hypothetical protein
MAIPMIKSTYTLDVDTIRLLDNLARRWNVSKSEALRRAIQAASNAAPPSPAPALAVLDALQRSAGVSSARANAWSAAVKRERRTGRTRGRRGAA